MLQTNVIVDVYNMFFIFKYILFTVHHDRHGIAEIEVNSMSHIALQCLIFSIFLILFRFILQSIEFFLAKNVTHFVTDKHIDRDGKLLTASPLSQPTPKTPQTPQAFGANQLNDLNDITASPNGGPYDARVRIHLSFLNDLSIKFSFLFIFFEKSLAFLSINFLL